MAFQFTIHRLSRVARLTALTASVFALTPFLMTATPGARDDVERTHPLQSSVQEEQDPKTVLGRIDAYLSGIEEKAKNYEGESRREMQKRLDTFKGRRAMLDEEYVAKDAENLLADLVETWKQLLASPETE